MSERKLCVDAQGKNRFKFKFLNFKLKTHSVSSTFYIFRKSSSAAVPGHRVHNMYTRFVYVIGNIVTLDDIRKRINEKRALTLQKHVSQCVCVRESFYLYLVKNASIFLRASVFR